MTKKIFEISKEDKENFIQALHTIFNLDEHYPIEQREFISQLKRLMDINYFKPYSLDNEEKDVVKIIGNIKNKDLINYLFLLAEEIEKKQTDKNLHKTKMEKIVSKLNPEIQKHINTKYKTSNNSSIEKQIDDFTKQGQEVLGETLKKWKSNLKKFLKDKK